MKYKYIWIGRRDIQNPHRQYEIGKFKKNWCPILGWPMREIPPGTPVGFGDMLTFANYLVEFLNIEIDPGTVVRIKIGVQTQWYARKPRSG